MITLSRLRQSPAVALLLLCTCAPGTQARGQVIPAQGSQIDVDIYGDVYVLDEEKNTLQLYDRSGALIREAGGPGWLDGQFDRPAGLWARNGIDVFVADYGNHRIERFDRKLNFISSFSTRDSDNPDIRFGYPTGIAISRQGDLYICDTENDQIVKVDRTNTVERTFGGLGAGEGRLITPRQVQLGPADAIYVLDRGRVAVFDAFGNFLRNLLPGVLAAPTVLYADETGVAVLDSASVFFFDSHERPAGVAPVGTLLPGSPAVRSFVCQGGSVWFLTASGVYRVSDPRRDSAGDRH